MYFFATFPIKYLRLSLKANLSAARARVVLPSESCNASLGPWSPCVSAVRRGVADRRPRQTGGHRRVTGGFVPRRDELRLETRRARVKPELQRLRWAGGRNMVAVGKKETAPRAIGSARPAPQRHLQQPVPPGAPIPPQLPAHTACLSPTRVGRIMVTIQPCVFAFLGATV